MTFADLLYKGFCWIELRFTRALAIAGGTIAILATSDIIPANHLKYWMAAIAVLTYWRGQATGKTYIEARAIRASTPLPPVIQSQVKP